MWTSYEISKVQELYEKLEDEKIEDILPDYLIAVIKVDGGTAYQNLR